MFAIFNKGQFVDFWLNEKSDSNWIERTIVLKNWNPTEVVVVEYQADVRNIGPILFSDEFEVIPGSFEIVQVENPETQVMEDKKIFVPQHDAKISPILWYQNGQRLLPYL